MQPEYRADPNNNAHAINAKGKAVHRQTIGRMANGDEWDNRIHDDLPDWPLAKALKADKQNDLLEVARQFRRIYDQAHTHVEIMGSDYERGSLYVVHRTSVDKKTGAVQYGKVLRSHSADTIATEAARRRVGDTSRTIKGHAPVARRWEGDHTINRMLDARRLLADLLARLGPIRDEVVAAVVHGDTMEDVGRMMGASNQKYALGAGKQVVLRGLVAVRDALADMRRNPTVH
ncbi:hypothetical protein HW532_12835 [Kaustia mangrovi]|uniref:Uncharacterized protein n=1 Tax=Kaustia mangrovi TaxID=2593653 RepID=A0A7S8C525_9HYPH|nr:hypothetical protein [Kaustia mangrovi]QPC43503.1 hypothetical protein HW532_12835 [Kaustia mangrovi]